MPNLWIMWKRSIALGFIGALLVAGLPAQATHTSSKRWSTERWKRTLSQPKYSGVVRSTHYLEAKDGTQLSLTVHLPDGLPESEKVPTLMQMTPYRPLDQIPGGYADYEFFVLRGAAYVEADERGTGGSDGCLDFGGSADRSDAKVFARWIRSQPWSDGRIVTDGVSHPGMGSVVAHAAIPGLTGALAHAPVVSYYQDEWLQGAKFEDQFNGPAYQVIELAPPLPPSFAQPEAVTSQAATCTGETTTDYSTYDGPFTDLWADRDLSRFTPKDRKPILLTHGFVDLNVHPDHSQLYWDALPDNYPKYAIFGWWYHGYPDMKGHAATSFDFIRHRWMDALLFKTENGLRNEPRVLVEDSLGVWHEGHDWPLEQSRTERLFTGDEGKLGGAPGKSGGASYVDALGAQRGSWDNASAVFETDPVSQDMLVNGAPDVFLKGSSSENSTKWVAYLMDVAPDGSWERISHGYADSHTWKDRSRWDDIEPGKAYRWKIDLMPTAVVVKKGHKIALVIASQDSRQTSIDDNCFDDHRGGCYNPSGILPALTVGRAENTVHTGKGGTYVRFDWANPKKTVKAPTPAGP
ncbi:MAG: CocE/NonD family hydrolase [Actinobacteria bacterium]|nr:CocE/NonD family hydrolase [Actinomycetota bacterium]